jgi:hypothetical protein
VRRRLIIDASLDTRVATELKYRGRDAVSAAELGLGRVKDPDLLAGLAKITDPWVLVTGDDRMPYAHPAAIAAAKATIATVDGEWERVCARAGVVVDQSQFARETVHRWAHAMAQQSPGSIRRYSITSNLLWRARLKYGR